MIWGLAYDIIDDLILATRSRRTDVFSCIVVWCKSTQHRSVMIPSIPKLLTNSVDNSLKRYIRWNILNTLNFLIDWPSFKVFGCLKLSGSQWCLDN